MEDILSADEHNGIKFVWNTLPGSRSDATKIVVPVGFHYNPLIKNENLSLLEYEPLKCRCGSIISPIFNFSAKAKVWECPFCRNRNTFLNHILILFLKKIYLLNYSRKIVQ